MVSNASRVANLDVRLSALGDALARDPEVRFAYLFGSHARGGATPLSDVDIAVYVSDAADPLDISLRLNVLACDVLGAEDVDVVILNRAPLSLRARIVSNRRILADREPDFRARFESLTQRMGWDFEHLERTMVGLPRRRAERHGRSPDGD